MSKIIAILNQKGGSGKTTIATNLACAFQFDGAKVLLVDSDPQGSARDWRAAAVDDNGIDQGTLAVIGIDRPTLAKDIQAVTENYDWIIIDGAPQIAEMAVAAIKCADVVLVPVQPSPFDLWACSDLVDVIKARQEVTDGRPKAAFLISRTIKNTHLGREVRKALNGYDLPVFKSLTTHRVIYAKSASTGKSVLDTESDGDAAREIRAIAKELKEFTHVS